ncbi:LysR substrate-binding domain-containing protein [Sphingobium sp.]|uniref:LysR family transcriptional regulator n=1 Tax=Sphingobium sp. TaxID=1912891 RepID=UPI0028BD465E|nr:LysR substrate-binding domain-containing protein [Sphingobium sp.]
MIDDRSLRSFIALAEELHFARTADRLGIAQSALSMQIKRLEDRLGTPLLTRGKRAAVRLTQAGETFLKEGRAAIAQLERAERIGRLAGKGEAGPINLGYIFSAAICGLLARALGIIQSRFPHLEIRAETMTTPDQLTALADGRLDIGFGRRRSSYPEGISVDPVYTEDVVLLVGAKHRLACRESVAPAALKKESFLVPSFEDGAGLIENQERLAAAGAFHTIDMLRVKDFITAACMAAGGYGVVLAPRSMTRLHLGDVKVVEIAGYSDQVETVMAYRSEMPSLLAKALLAEFREPELPGH